MIVTFYSFKGGVGRSLAMANVAEILVDLGYRVMMCDWDLEAPGLERYVAATKQESDWLAEKPGLIDLLITYKKVLSGTPDHEAPPAVQAKVGELSLRRPSSYAIPIPPPEWHKDRAGSLSLLTAGRRRGPRGDEFHAYADAVRTFDWDEFYEEWAGGAYMDFLRADLEAGRPPGDRNGPPEPAADLVLIDSRTGVTEHGGVATHHLADIVVVLSAANDLNLDGTTWMADALARPSLKEVRGGRPLIVLPVPSRIEQTSERDLVGSFRRKFADQFGQYLPATLGAPKEFFLDCEIPYLPFYSFTERVAARERPELRDELMYRKYEALSHAILECGTEMQLVSSSSIPATVRFRRMTRTTEPPRGVFTVRHTADNVQAAAAVSAALAQAGATITNDRASTLAATSEAGSTPSGIVVVVGPVTPEKWVQAEIQEGLRRQATGADFRIVPVVIGDVPVTTLQHLSRLRVVTINPAVIERDVHALTAALASKPTVTPEGSDVCPFPGPRGYMESEARFLFGRDGALRQLAETMDNAREVRWLQITGPAGAGKTSFAQAAVIPALRRGVLRPATTVGTIASITFGKDAAVALTSALGRAFSGSVPPADIDAAVNGAGSLSDIIRRLTPAGETFVLFVDDYSAEGGVTTATIRQKLRQAIEDPELPFLLITASEAAPAAGMPATVQFELASLTPAQWSEIAMCGARSTGLSWHEKAFDAFVRDATELNGKPLLAPLLGLTLQELWRNPSGTSITYSAYQTIGGGLLPLFVREAEARIKALPEKRRPAAKRVLVSTIDKGGLLAVPRHVALSRAGIGAEGEELLTHLAAPPALIQDGAAIRLADAMLLGWPRLGEWIDDERARRTRRNAVRGVATAAMILLYVAAWSSVKQWQANRLQHAASLAAAAAQETDPVRSLALAVTAAETAETDSARAALERALADVYPTAVLGHAAPVKDAAFNSDASRVIAGTTGEVRIWNVATGGSPAISPLTVNVPGAVTSVRFSPDRRYAAATTFDGGVVLINPESAAIRQLNGHAGSVLDSNFSNDSKLLVTAGLDGSALVWETVGGSVRRELKGHTAAVTSVSFSPDDSEVLTTSLDGTAVLWSLRNAKSTVIAQAALPLKAAAFGAGYIAAAGAGGVFVQPAQPPALQFLADETVASAFAANRHLAAAGKDMIYVWNLNAARSVLKLAVPPAPDGADGVVSDLALDPSGRHLAVGMADGRIFRWEVSDDVDARAVERTRVTLRAHSAAINRLRFSADGTQLLSASDDSTVCVWSLSPSSPPAGIPFASLLASGQAIVSRLLTRDQLAAIVSR